MKPDQDDCLEAEGDLGKRGRFSLGKLPTPKIVGQVGNPVLEGCAASGATRSIEFCGFFVLIRRRCTIASTDQNRPHLPTYSARQITSGWSGFSPRQPKRSNRETTGPRKIKAAK